MNADVLQTSTAQTRETLLDLEQVLGQISDADLHRAEPNGGWTCAQVVSHIHMCTLLWIADLERFRNHPDSSIFIFREELGHDVLGAPPPSADDARRRIASVRTAVEQCWPHTDPHVLSKSVEIPTLGTKTVADWFGIIVGHTAMHVGQVKAILQSRGIPFEAVSSGDGVVAAAGPDI